MTDASKPEAEDAQEAESMGEKPDLGHTADALNDAMSGTNMGSDTRAGSLRGGSASGSEIDPDQGEIDETLTSEGVNTPASPAPKADPEPVKNTGEDLLGPGGDPAEGKRKDADAATG